MNKQKKLNNMALTPLALGVMLAMQVEAAPMILIGDNVSIDDTGNANQAVASGNVFDDAAGNTDNADKVSITAANGVEITGTLQSTDKLTVDAGGVEVTAGGITATAGDITATAGGITATAGNIEATAGTVTAGAGVTATAGGITATAGDITATAGGITATAGDITATAGNIEATAGTVTGGTVTDGTARMTGGNVTGLGSISTASDNFHVDGATGDVTTRGKIKGDALTIDGITVDNGNITGIDELTVDVLTVNQKLNVSTTSAAEISTKSSMAISNVVGAADSSGVVKAYDSLISGSVVTNDLTSATVAVKDSNNEASLKVQSDSVQLGVTTNSFHGVSVTTDSTTISGGTKTTSLEMDDDGARFSSTMGAGGNAKVSGIADGVNTNDAVNRGQLNTAYAGVASVAALAALPQPAPGRHFSLGVGTSYYQGESGVALGMKGSLTDTTQFTLGGSWNSSGDSLVNGGVGMSW